MATTYTSTSSTDYIWSGWVSDATFTTSASYTTNAWNAWNYATQPLPTPRDQVINAEQAANERAERLLKSMLDAEQLASYNKDGFFFVVKPNGKYRIRRGRAYNVDRYDEKGEIKEKLCATPNINVPIADHMLAQLLHLTYGEDAFAGVANHSRL